eukprot:TRINITY_DN2180_c0_g4_i1.p1 TRINITY_DN2180_c0_g4~~TRINITY_DN2180_c0_g4_i1.p1  ORF type:complete len:323 (-),score=62.89 TRINITY_DN2180_c0_g4_i1:269-1237(-)
MYGYGTRKPAHMLDNPASRKPIYLIACAFFIFLHLFFVFVVFRSVVHSDDVVKVKRRNLSVEELTATSNNMIWPSADLNHLIIVTGHAIYKGKMFDPESIRDEHNWELLSYQKGQLATYLEHIKVGVELASTDNRSLLVFSGGETREKAGPRSEAQMYWEVADVNDWYGVKEKVEWRTTTEEFARNSFENLLFSICRFKEATGEYPRNITIIGFEFKKERFVNYHRAAVRFPLPQFNYVGVNPIVDPPHFTEDSLQSAINGEIKTREEFKKDPYGCATKDLSLKSKERNPFRREHPYPKGCMELKGLFGHCTSTLYKGVLPW